MYLFIYMYIYIKREREKERERVVGSRDAGIPRSKTAHSRDVSTNFSATRTPAHTGVVLPRESAATGTPPAGEGAALISQNVPSRWF